MTEPVFGNVTWTDIYDASSGVAPTDALWGFTQTGTFGSTATADGWHRMTKAYTGSSVGAAYYSKSNPMPAPVSGKVLVTHVRARMESGHRYSATLRYGFGGLTGQGYDELYLRGDWASWSNTQWAMSAYGGILVPKGIFAAGTAFDLFLVWRLSGTTSGINTHEIWHRNVGSYNVDSAAGLSMIGRNGGYASSLNQMIFGDYYDGYGADWSVALIRAGVTDDAQILSTTGLPLLESPSVEPAIAVTVSPASIGAGEEAQATASLTNTTATLNDSPWDGSNTTVATGTAAALIGPSAPAPTIGQTPTRDQPVIRYTGGAMRIYYSSTQPTTYTLQRRAYPGGTTWSTDATQGTNPVNVSALTYDGSTPGTSYATNHGWSLATDGTYEYRILPTYSDGSIGQPSVPILPNDAADYQITVGGTVPTSWAGKTVRAELSELVTIGGREYPRGGSGYYSSTVGADGAWSISGLPRLAAATAGDGAGTLVAYFLFPDGSRVPKILPDQATATFASLANPS